MQDNLSLITENTFNDSKVGIDKVGVDGKPKEYYIEGIFLQGNIINKNKRLYPTNVLEESVNDFNKKIEQFKMVAGELSHPPHTQIDPDRISHYITELRMDGNNGYGRAKIASTPKGMLVRNLIDDGFPLGVSTRGLGQVSTNTKGENIVDAFSLVTVDIVTEPSAPDAYVESMMESIKYMIDDDQTIKVQSLEGLLENITRKLSVLPKKSEEKKGTYYSVLNDILNNI
jgi:hypothetical protein